MPNRITELVTRLIARDDASKVIEKVAGELDSLEKRDTEVELTADDQASAEIRSVSELLAGLTDEDREFILRAKVTDAERDVGRLLKSLKDVDKLDGEEVRIRVEALGDARAELDRLQDEVRQLDAAKVDIDVEASGLDDVVNKLGSMPGLLGDVASSLGPGGAIAAGVGALLTAAGSVADEFADSATEVRTLMELTGASSEEASRLQAVWKGTGADVNDLNDIILQMNGVLQQSPELAAQLGINLADGATGAERFVQVMEALRDVQGDSNERALLFSQLLGEEGARQGAKLLGIVEDIDAAKARVAEGQVFTEDELATAEEIARRSAETSAAWESVKNDLGEIVAGPMADLLSQITGVLGGLQVLVSGEAFKPEFWEGAARGGTDLLGIADEGLRKEQERRRNADEINEVIRRGIDLAVQADKAGEDQADAAERTARAREDDLARLGLATGRLQAHATVQAEIREEMEATADQWVRMIEGAIAWSDEGKQARQVLREFRTEAKRSETAAAGFATAWADMADSTAGAKTNLADLVSANQNLIDGFRDSEGRIRQSRTELDVMSESGQANIAAAEALRDAYGKDLAQALEDAGGKYRVVRQRAAFWRQELEGQLEALGLSKEQIDEYVTALGLTPEQVTTTIQLSKQEEAMAQLDALNVDLDEIDDKEVAASIATKISMGDYIGARDEVVDYYALNPAVLPVKPVVGEYVYPPGLIPSGSTFAAPAGLSASPMAFGATATAGPTLQPMMLPVAAAKPPTVVNVYSSVNAAVVGDTFAVMRAVEDANRRAARLMPKNP